MSLFHNKLKNIEQATYYIDEALRYVEEGLIGDIECVITIWQMIEVKKNDLESFELINAYTELRNHLKTIMLDNNSREMINIDIEIAIMNNKLDEVLKLLNMAVELNYIDVVEFTMRLPEELRFLSYFDDKALKYEKTAQCELSRRYGR